MQGTFPPVPTSRRFRRCCFFNKRVLDIDLPWLGDLIRPRKPQRPPAVLTREEVNALLAHIKGTPLRLTFCNQVTTSARSRNSWGTRT
jgi:integrase